MEGASLIFVSATGMVTAIGNTADATCAAMRAEIAGFQEIPFVDGAGRIIIGAPARNAVAPKLGIPMFVEMVSLSIEQCLKDRSICEIPLLIGLPLKDETGRPRGLDQRMLSDLENRLGQALHPSSGVVPLGGVSCFHALLSAARILSEGHCNECLVCGVDSLINGPSLKALERKNRLKTDTNPDGLIPGEAASCILVSRKKQGDGGNKTIICGFGFSTEDVDLTSNEPVTGVGLASAIKAALSDSGMNMGNIDFRFSDITGERRAFQEANYALGRVLRERKEKFPFLHLMDTIGSVGAAAGCCIIAHLKHLFERDAAPGETALCETSSNDGARAVVIVQSKKL